MLASWADSPTRFREDANAEEDLRLGGYRERLLVELAQNAADAAGHEGGGVLSVDVVDGELRVANTGAPLTASGVQALASLRASSKRGEQTVGRFGVGFAAVLAVTASPRVVSRSGGVVFSATATREAVVSAASEAPQLAAELRTREAAAAPDASVPVLRLPWPSGETPPAGYDTEVRLPLRDGVDVAELLDACARQAGDLLLALPGLAQIRVGERRWTRTDVAGGIAVVHGPDEERRWLLQRAGGELPDELRQVSGTESRARWLVCWALPVDEAGDPVQHDVDVLHVPTPTDERLSLPARLLAGVPVEPGRRRVHGGPVLETVLDAAADAYRDLVDRLTPHQRLEVVPEPAFPASEVDGSIRDRLTRRLSQHPWLPGVDGSALAPASAMVLDVASEELAGALEGALPRLATATCAHRRYARALAALGVTRVGSAEIVEAVTGLERPPAWWHALYSACTSLAEDAAARENLAGLPVPLADGRTATGVPEVLLPGDSQDGADLAEIMSTVDVPGLRIAHPDAVHPLLERLGAKTASAADVLTAPALREAVERSLDDAESGADGGEFAAAVLAAVRAAGARPGEHPWLAALALPDTEGGYRRADELLLPDAPLATVLDPELVGPDGPLGTLDSEVAQHWPSEVLRAVGVLHSFTVLVDDEPSAPDHDLADEEQWWDAHSEPPHRVLAVRDLDLVAADAWPEALRLLAADPDCHRALTEPGGYTGWWLARHARLAGRAPRHWRLAQATALAGLYDAVPDVGLDADLLHAVGVRTALQVDSSTEAADVLSRLADRDREVAAEVVLRAHRALAVAVADGAVDVGNVDPPAAVRALSGDVVRVEGAQPPVVVDRPWLYAVVPEERTVACGGSASEEESLADVLDLPVASEGWAVTASSAHDVSWSDVNGVAAVCALLGVSVPASAVALHDTLTVHGRSVPWWVDPDGTVHADGTDGRARALAWDLDRWALRHALQALLADPRPWVLLR